jgi:hypothetical protein
VDGLNYTIVSLTQHTIGRLISRSAQTELETHTFRDSTKWRTYRIKKREVDLGVLSMLTEWISREYQKDYWK